MDRTSLCPMVTRLRRGEVGAASSVYAGTIVVAVIVVVALIVGMTPIGQRVVTGVSNDICRVFGLGCVNNQAGPQSVVDSMRPKECTVATREESGSYFVKLGIVKLGPTSSLSVKQEQYLDEKTGEVKTRYYATPTDGFTAGVEGGFGAKGEVNGVGVGVDVSAEGGVDLRSGGTWIFETKEGLDDFVKQNDAYRQQQKDMTTPGLSGMGPNGNLMYQLYTGGIIEPPRSPDLQSTIVKTEVKANADAGALAGRDNALTGQESFNTKVGGYVEAKLAEEHTLTKDVRADHKGEFSRTYTYSGSIGGGANAAFQSVGGSGTYKGETTYAYKPGPNNEPVLSSVTLTNTIMGDVTSKDSNGPVNKVGAVTGTGSAEAATQKARVTTTTIEVNDKNRAAVEEWVANSTRTGANGNPAILLPEIVFDPSEELSADATELEKVLHSAKHTIDFYDIIGDKQGASAEVAMGAKAGAGYEQSKENWVLTDSQYLAPASTPGGKREYRNNLVCN